MPLLMKLPAIAKAAAAALLLLWQCALALPHGQHHSGPSPNSGFSNETANLFVLPEYDTAQVANQASLQQIASSSRYVIAQQLRNPRGCAFLRSTSPKGLSWCTREFLKRGKMREERSRGLDGIGGALRRGFYYEQSVRSSELELWNGRISPPGG